MAGRRGPREKVQDQPSGAIEQFSATTAAAESAREVGKKSGDRFVYAMTTRAATTECLTQKRADYHLR